MTTVRGEGLDVTAFSVVTEDEIKLAVKLRSTDAVGSVTARCPLRVVCLMDTSRSMLQYSDRKRKRSKLQVIRDFCRILIDVLSDGDGLSLVTFDNETLVLLEMTEIGQQSKREVPEIIEQIKCHGDSTDLGKGLATAFDQLTADNRNERSRDIIVVMTDGEINAGITESRIMNMWLQEKVVRMVRNTPEWVNGVLWYDVMVAPRDGPTSLLWKREVYNICTQNQPWRYECPCQHGEKVTLIVVKTGGSTSDMIMDVSEKFGSQPYIYLDGRSDMPEIGMMLPVMTHQLASIFNVAMTITAFHGVRIDWANSTKTYLKHRYTIQYPSEVRMFMSDVGQISTRNISLILIPGLGYEDLDESVVILTIQFEYSDKEMGWKTLTLSLTKGDMDVITDASKHAIHADEIKHRVQECLTSASQFIRKGNKDECVKALESCQAELNQIREEIGDDAGMSLSTAFIDMVKERMVDLIKSIQHSPKGDGHKWNRIMALKSAVERDSLGLSETVEVILSGKDDDQLELDDDDDLSLCVAMIKQVAGKLGNLASTVHTAQTLPMGMKGLGDMGTADYKRSNSASLSRVMTARNRIRMTTDIDNLLKSAENDLVAAMPGKSTGSSKVADNRNWEDILEEMESTNKVESNTEFSYNKPVMERHSYENWLTGAMIKPKSDKLDKLKKKVVKHESPLYENWSGNGIVTQEGPPDSSPVVQTKQNKVRKHQSVAIDAAKSYQIGHDVVSRQASDPGKRNAPPRTEYTNIQIVQGKTVPKTAPKPGGTKTPTTPTTPNPSLNYVSVEIVKGENNVKLSDQ